MLPCATSVWPFPPIYRPLTHHLPSFLPLPPSFPCLTRASRRRWRPSHTHCLNHQSGSVSGGVASDHDSSSHDGVWLPPPSLGLTCQHAHTLTRSPSTHRAPTLLNWPRDPEEGTKARGRWRAGGARPRHTHTSRNSPCGCGRHFPAAFWPGCLETHQWRSAAHGAQIRGVASHSRSNGNSTVDRPFLAVPDDPRAQHCIRAPSFTVTFA